MRFIPLFLSLAACSYDEQAVSHNTEACNFVSKENWYMSHWDRNRSPSEMCNGNAWVWGEGFQPCTLGGVPFLCMDREGTISVYQLDGSVVVHLLPEDRIRIGDGLKFIR